MCFLGTFFSRKVIKEFNLLSLVTKRSLTKLSSSISFLYFISILSVFFSIYPSAIRASLNNECIKSSAFSGSGTVNWTIETPVTPSDELEWGTSPADKSALGNSRAAYSISSFKSFAFAFIAIFLVFSAASSISLNFAATTPKSLVDNW